METMRNKDKEKFHGVLKTSNFFNDLENQINEIRKCDFEEAANNIVSKYIMQLVS